MGDELIADSGEFFYGGEWKSAKEYSKDFEDGIEEEKKVAGGLKWDEEYPSDHLPVLGFIKEFHLPVVSWNILNFDMMLKHQLKDTVGTEQGLKDHKMFQPENFEHRADLIVEKVSNYIKSGYLVCLQEVTRFMLKMIKL